MLSALEGIAESFNASSEKKVSLADLIVLAGGVGVEQAATAGGYDVEVPFTPGRVDAGAEHTDVKQFGYLEPVADGFRNYYGKDNLLPAECLLLDKANLLALSAPETAVLVGGLRVLGANFDKSALGVLTETPGKLTNDFFVTLLDLGTTWTATSEDPETSETFEAKDDAGAVRWTGSRVDLVFGSNSELRAVAELTRSPRGSLSMRVVPGRQWRITAWLMVSPPWHRR